MHSNWVSLTAHPLPPYTSGDNLAQTEKCYPTDPINPTQIYGLPGTPHIHGAEMELLGRIQTCPSRRTRQIRSTPNHTKSDPSLARPAISLSLIMSSLRRRCLAPPLFRPLSTASLEHHRRPHSCPTFHHQILVREELSTAPFMPPAPNL